MLIIIHKTYHRHIAWPQPEDLAHSSPVVEDENTTSTSASHVSTGEIKSREKGQMKKNETISEKISRRSINRSSSVGGAIPCCMFHNKYIYIYIKILVLFYLCAFGFTCGSIFNLDVSFVCLDERV